MNLWERARIELAVQRFEYHLESRGTPGRRRRDLRRELRANLLEAAQMDGVAAALDGIGSPRALAVQVGELDRSRPRWWPGLLWGAVTFVVILVGMVQVNAVMLATLAAAGGGNAVIEVPPWWGVRFSAAVGSDGSIGAEGSLLWVVLPFVVFLVASQPWRPWTRREPSPTAAEAAAGR